MWGGMELMVKYSSIEYMMENGGQKTIIDKKKNIQNLSPFSISVLGSVLDQKVTVVFSQGSLNLSPIISCMFAVDTGNDVLIAIPGHPKNEFDSKFKKYTQNFHSLSYRKALEFGSGLFHYYENVLWCKGNINEKDNVFDSLDIETKPKHGNRQFKKRFEKTYVDSLESGKFQNLPKIVTIPIDSIIPSSIIGPKKIPYKKTGFVLDKFDPKLIIFESINERRHSFDSLRKLIKNVENKDVKLLLHFSWPYIKGVKSFIEDIQGNKNVNIFHFGKRYSAESTLKESVQDNDLKKLSLEGENWDDYYPDNKKIEYELISTCEDIKSNKISVKEISEWDFTYDRLVYSIRGGLNYTSTKPYDTSLLAFPPIFSSVLSPSEITRRFKIRGTVRTLPIADTLSSQNKDNGNLINNFKGLCNDFDKYRDLVQELNGIKTHSRITKKTLFQAYILEKLAKSVKQYIELNSVNEELIVVCNVEPYVFTESKFYESINYLTDTVEKITNTIQFSTTFTSGSTLTLNVTGSGHSLKYPIISSGNICKEEIVKLKRTFKEINPKLNFEINLDDHNFVNVSVFIDIFTEYMKLNQEKEYLFKNIFENLVVYDSVIDLNNQMMIEKSIKEISCQRKYDRSQIEIVMYTRKNHRLEDETTKRIEIKYKKLNELQNMNISDIKLCELIIPGSIPFQSLYDNNELLLAQGFDSLIRPFKKIIFMTYPGKDFKKIQTQISINNQLLSEEHTPISIIDLDFSIQHTKDYKSYKIPTLPSEPIINKIFNQKSSSSTSSEEVITQKLLDIEAIPMNNGKITIKSIETMFQNLNNKQLMEEDQNGSNEAQRVDKDHVYFEVQYDDEITETISFPMDTIIRKQIGDQYDICSINDIEIADRIFYINAEERESIENYLMRVLFQNSNCNVDEILEPITCLNIFYNTLKSIDYKKTYDTNKMKKIYWLSEPKKKALFDLISMVTNVSESIVLDQAQIKNSKINQIYEESVWYNLISLEDLILIFKGTNTPITKKKLYEVSVIMGLDYVRESFNSLCSKNINDSKHYSFHKSQNLLAIGRLIGHKKVTENYIGLNTYGQNIRTFLQQVGYSIKRVASGNEAFINDIDLEIKDKMQQCVVIKIING